jgi:predicted RNA-binding protein with EMAP domain
VRAKRLPVPANWQRAAELVREARGLVKGMRYSFLPATMLARSEEAARLQEVVRELTGLLLNPQWLDRLRGDPRARRPLAEARYALRTLYGLPARLALGDENDPFYAFDIECVTVTSVSRHPSADNLYVTTARGRLAYTIVTNLGDVRRGQLRAAAILPPREFRGVVSEAMYCSRRPLSEEEGCAPGRRPPRSLVELGEIGAVLAEIARSTH